MVPFAFATARMSGRLLCDLAHAGFQLRALLISSPLAFGLVLAGLASLV